LERARNEAVVDVELLLELQLRVAALQVARPIAGDARAQDQILSARGRADRSLVACF
jgi:hypothetical protein